MYLCKCEGLKSFCRKNRWYIVLITLGITHLKILPQRESGFICDDKELNYSYIGDTISWPWLMSVCILLPLVVLLITERLYNSDKQKSKEIAVKYYKQYLFVFLINLTIVSLLKMVVGSPRPHFFETCQPSEMSNCKSSEFISEYKCTRAEHWSIQSARSFPSGHASLSVYAGVFIFYYVYKRVPSTTLTSDIIPTLLAVTSLFAAFECSRSRITDHRHHTVDVLAGAGIGVIGVFYTIYYLCNNFNMVEDKAIEVQA